MPTVQNRDISLAVPTGRSMLLMEVSWLVWE
jgi:hypothetical protein